MSIENSFGKNLEEEQEKRREQIPTMIEVAKGTIPANREKIWEEYLNASAEMPFEFPKPQDILILIEMLSSGANFVAVKEKIEEILFQDEIYMDDVEFYRNAFTQIIGVLHERGADFREGMDPNYAERLEQKKAERKAQIPDILEQSQGIVAEEKEDLWRGYLESNAEMPEIFPNPKDILTVMKILSTEEFSLATLSEASKKMEEILEQNEQYKREKDNYRKLFLSDLTNFHERGSVFETVMYKEGLESEIAARKVQIPGILKRSEGLIVKGQEEVWKGYLEANAEMPELQPAPTDIVTLMEMLSEGATFAEVSAKMEEILAHSEEYSKDIKFYRDSFLSDLGLFHSRGYDFRRVIDSMTVETDPLGDGTVIMDIKHAKPVEEVIWNFKDAIKYLIECREAGKNVYMDFGERKILYSADVTLDRACTKFLGISGEEYETKESLGTLEDYLAMIGAPVLAPEVTEEEPWIFWRSSEEKEQGIGEHESTPANTRPALEQWLLAVQGEKYERTAEQIKTTAELEAWEQKAAAKDGKTTSPVVEQEESLE